mmetsp:Transcript_7691/g.26080  ORF Transcript_7691/g.26080 Transcript_7691/m.26080 type:complete len:235 (+) Transcript_7691:229-933(+)
MSAKRSPSRWRRFAAVVTRRLPVAPKGWPRDRDPPSVLSRSMSTRPTFFPPRFSSAYLSESMAVRLASTWPAKASCSSTTPMSPSPSPAMASTLWLAWVGPRSRLSKGSTATKVQALSLALGVRPRASAFSSDMSSVAAAPSVRNDELAAVWVPCGLMNAGLSLARPSAVESGLMPFSCVTPPTGTISSSYRPSAWARPAFWCERAAKASWSARDTPNLAARRSELWPMTSPVV